MTMYNHHLTLDECKAAVEAADVEQQAIYGHPHDYWEIDTTMYDKGGDRVVVSGIWEDEICDVLYAPELGTFLGQLGDGTMFSSNNAVLDDEPWFQAMLAFFYSFNQPKKA